MAYEVAVRIFVVAALVLLATAAGAALWSGRRARAEVRDSVWGHLEDLRRRLLRASLVLVLGTALALVVRLDLRGSWPVPVPALFDSLASQAFRAMAQDLVPPGVRLVVTSPLDGFSAQFAMAVALGFLLALPVLLHQLGGFVAPALRASERRMLAWAVLPAMALFALGAAFAYLLVLPATLAALYQFSDALGAESLLQAGDLSSFTLAFVLGFGLAFQAPLVMVALSRVGLVHPRVWWRHWRHAIVLILVLAMVVTPDPTILSQLMLAGPLSLLYVLGAVAARPAWRKAQTAA